jgi:hypothetical protein
MSFPKTREEMEAANYMRNGTEMCKGCGAAMEFWITPEMKAIPMNPMPQPTSNAISHFATCPYAARFRKTRSAP